MKDFNDRQAVRYSLEDLDMFCQLAASAAIQTALQAIEDEPEVPGPMPDEMWEAIRNDRDACENAIRIAVRLTKEGIRDRLLSEPQSERVATQEEK